MDPNEGFSMPFACNDAGRREHARQIAGELNPRCDLLFLSLQPSFCRGILVSEVGLPMNGCWRIWSLGQLTGSWFDRLWQPTVASVCKFRGFAGK